MSWPPKIPPGPIEWQEFGEALIARIDGNEPKDGHGVRTSDATGGGKILDSQTSGPGVALKDCVFFDADAGDFGEFFYTDVYTTGRKKLIPVPPSP